MDPRKGALRPVVAATDERRDCDILSHTLPSNDNDNIMRKRAERQRLSVSLFSISIDYVRIEQFTPNKQPRFPVPDGFTRPLRTSPHSPQTRRVPNFHSDFTLSRASSSDLPHPAPSTKQKQKARTRPLPVVDLERVAHDCRPVTNRTNEPLRPRSAQQDALVPIENVPALGSTRVFSPPPMPLLIQRPSSSTKILEPPRISSPPPRPCTPPKNLAAPDLSRFMPTLHDPPRPSKPVSRTRIALATDLWTEGGRADVLALALELHGVPYATPMEKAGRRGLEVSPRKSGIGKEIRHAR
jgi:hypothetical protein